MSSIINATTSPPGLVQSSDGTSSLRIQVGDQDAIFINSNRSVTVNTSLNVTGANVLTTSSLDVANVLYTSNIGSTVQAYNANTSLYTDATSNFTGVLQVSGANVLTTSAIGSTVQAYDANTAKLNVEQSFTAQQTFVELKETVFETGTSNIVNLNPANGSIQTTTMANNVTYTESLESGQSILLGIDDGSSYAVTWPTITWTTTSNSAPTLYTTGYTWVILWKVGANLYGKY